MNGSQITPAGLPSLTVEPPIKGGRELKSMVVLCREAGASPFSTPLGFTCDAEHSLHAEEQCLDAYPGADVLWVEIGTTLEQAL